MTTTRFGRKLSTPSTFQIKHRFLLWWLKNQAAKEATEASAEKSLKGSPMHVHEAA
jgi:hypothetical protein